MRVVLLGLCQYESCLMHAIVRKCGSCSKAIREMFCMAIGLRHEQLRFFQMSPELEWCSLIRPTGAVHRPLHPGLSIAHQVKCKVCSRHTDAPERCGAGFNEMMIHVELDCASFSRTLQVTAAYTLGTILPTGTGTFSWPCIVTQEPDARIVTVDQWVEIAWDSACSL